MPQLDTKTGRPLLGLLSMAGAALLWSVMTLFVKVLGDRMPIQQVVFVMSGVMAISSAALTWATTDARLFAYSTSAERISQRFLWLRGGLGFASMSCFFFALTKLPLADATVFQYTNPVFTAIIAAVVLGEAIERSEVGGVLMSLVGVACIAQPTFLFGSTGGNLNLVYVGIGLLGALLAGGAYVTVRRLRTDRHPYVIIFYLALVSCIGSAPLTLMAGVTWPTPLEWVYLIVGVGGLSQVAQFLVTYGLHAVKAGRAMAITYLQIVFAAAWGMLLFEEVPGLWSVFGAILVMSGTLLAARGS